MNSLIFEKWCHHLLFQTFNQRPLSIGKLKNMRETQQVHGVKVLGDEDFLRGKKEEQSGDREMLVGDGLCTSFGNQSALLIKTADCLPIVAIGKKGWALLHAGYRGIAKQIFNNRKIAQLCPFYFYLGPGIHVKNFAVGEDFRAYFPHSKHFVTLGGRLHFDLYGETIERLQYLYPHAVIEGADAPCTFASEEFFSYRRNKTPLRNWNILTAPL